MNSVQYTDFSGGFTDYYVGADPTRHQKMDNLLINPNRKPYQRPGSAIYDSVAYQIPTANRIGALINHSNDDTLLAYSSDRVFAKVGSSYLDLTGPTGNQAFPGAGTGNVLSATKWKKQTYLTTDALLSPPIKIYKDQTGTFKMRTAGLPIVPTVLSDTSTNILNTLTNVATTLKAKLVFHMTTDSTAHQVFDTASSMTMNAPTPTDLPSLITYVSQLLSALNQHVNEARKQQPVVHKWQNLPDPNHSFINQSVATLACPGDYSGIASTLDDLASKFLAHAGDWNIHVSVPFNGVSTGDGSGATGGVIFADNIFLGPCVSFDLNPLYALANQLKAKFNSHITRAGSVHTASSPAIQVTVPDATDRYSLANVVKCLRIAYDMHSGGDSAQYAVHASSATTSFPSERPSVTPDYQKGDLTWSNGRPGSSLWCGSSPGDYLTQLTYLIDLQAKFNAHQANAAEHSNPASPVLPGNANLDPVHIPAPAFANYLYAFHYVYDYQTQDALEEIVGPVLEIGVFNTYPTTFRDLVLNNISQIQNTTYTNYDTANLKINIYRTTNGGTTFYQVGQISNGTTSFTDRMSDDLLQNQSTIYITGGVLDHDPAPICKTLHVSGDTGYFGNILEVNSDGTTTSLPRRVRQSLPAIIGSSPGSFFDDMDDDVVALSSAGSRVVALCKKTSYRIDGTFDESGRGGMTHERISSTVGCVAPQSVIQVDKLVLFAGTDGFYFTDGFQVQKISNAINETYKAIISTDQKKSRIQASYDPKQLLVYWTAQFNDSSPDCDTLLVLDLRWGLTSQSTFTTFSNGSNFRPTSVCVFNNQLLRGDLLGYVFSHDSSLSSDPKIGVGNPSGWTRTWIPYTLTLGATNFGQERVRKWTPGMNVSCKNKGKLSLAISSINDDSGVLKPLIPIRYRNTYVGQINENRYFPAGTLRCVQKQVSLTPAKTVILNSDSVGMATVDPVGKTVTLNSGYSQQFPTDSIDWFITFGADSYTAQYPITANTGLTLTVTDPSGTLPSGSQKWELWGVPKDEFFELHSLTIHYNIDGTTQQGFQGSTGENA